MVKINMNYYDKLDSLAQKRYREKLDMAGLSYLSKNFITESNQLWPEVDYPDIYNYHINTTSLYSSRPWMATISLFKVG